MQSDHRLNSKIAHRVIELKIDIGIEQQRKPKLLVVSMSHIDLRYPNALWSKGWRMERWKLWRGVRQQQKSAEIPLQHFAISCYGFGSKGLMADQNSP